MSAMLRPGFSRMRPERELWWENASYEKQVGEFCDDWDAYSAALLQKNGRNQVSQRHLGTEKITKIMTSSRYGKIDTLYSRGSLVNVACCCLLSVLNRYSQLCQRIWHHISRGFGGENGRRGDTIGWLTRDTDGWQAKHEVCWAWQTTAIGGECVETWITGLYF